MFDVDKLPLFAGLIDNLKDETSNKIQTEIYRLTLVNQIAGACLFVNHLGIRPNDHGWYDGYDELATAIVDVYMDPAFDCPDGHGEHGSPQYLHYLDLHHRHVEAFQAVYDKYQVRGALETAIRYVLGR